MRARHRWLASVRLAAVVVGTCLWVVYGWTVATPTRVDRAGAVKGWDFPQFYVNGRLIAEGRAHELFDETSLAAATAAYVSSAVPYRHDVYGPHVSLLFAPLGLLSYGYALTAWLLASAALYAAAVASLLSRQRAIFAARHTVWLVAAAAPAWWLVVSYGQLSAWLLASVTAAMFCHGRGHRVLAGAALGLLLAKPQLLLPAAAVLALAGEAQIIAGIVVSVGVQCAVTASIVGIAPLLAYGTMAASFGTLASTLQSKPHLLQSFTAFWGLLVPGAPVVAWTLGLVCGLGAVVAGAAAWRRQASIDGKWEGVVCAMVLASPHLYVYDLLLLTPVVVGIVAAEGWRRTLVTLLLLVPLVGPFVASFTGVQLATLLVAAVLMDRTWAGSAAQGPGAK